MLSQEFLNAAFFPWSTAFVFSLKIGGSLSSRYEYRQIIANKNQPNKNIHDK